MNKLYKGLPLYQATIDMNDETGMEVISLVEFPAVEHNFIAFESQKEILKYSIENEEQRMVFGLVMAADMPIYRRDASGYEYYITYSAPTIAKMAEKYFKLSNCNNVDTEHDFELEEGITMVQMFIKDTENGVSPKGFEDVNDGSLFAQFHIENDEVWDAIKEGTYLGFSLAGCFIIEEIEFNKKEKNTSIMSKMSKLKTMLQNILAEFAQVSTDKGILSWASDGEMPEVGEAVSLIDEDGNENTPEDGDYTLSTGDVIVVAEGKVSEIKEGEKPTEEPKADEPKADEPKNEEFNEVKEAIVSKIQKYSESYDEKRQKIHNAIQAILPAMFSDYFYLYECGDDFAVIETYDENYNSRYFRFSIVWNEDEPAVEGEGVEGHIGFIANEEPKVEENVSEEFESKISDLEAKLAQFESENAELKTKVEELSKQPAAEPAEEIFNKVNKIEKTGNKGLDNLVRIINAEIK